eukprot:s821_g5.t6
MAGSSPRRRLARLLCAAALTAAALLMSWKPRCGSAVAFGLSSLGLLADGLTYRQGATVYWPKILDAALALLWAALALLLSFTKCSWLRLYAGVVILGALCFVSCVSTCMQVPWVLQVAVDHVDPELMSPMSLPSSTRRKVLLGGCWPAFFLVLGACTSARLGKYVVSEIVVSELREGFAPLKTAQPPLSTALQRANAAKARGSLQNYQASRILSSLADWGTMPGGAVPAWVEHLPADSPLGRRWTKAASMDLFAREPGLLFRMLMFCGEVQTLAMAGRSCCCWRQLLLDTARPSQSGTSQPPRRLWSWVLRFGRPPSASQRLGFWRWATSSLPEERWFGASLISPLEQSRSCSFIE